MRDFVQVIGAVSALMVFAAPAAHARSVAATRNIETTFLWTQTEAEQRCPQVAAEAGGRWTGDWRIAVPGRTSYCVVTDIQPERAARPARLRDIEAGPIWNQADAEDKCPRVAAAAQGRWTGQWRTVSPGASSVCEVALAPPPEPRPDGARFIDAGPIWNQADAEEKCPVVAAAVRGRWGGQWVTTVPGEMSTCGIVDMPPSRPRSVDAGPIWNQQDAEKKCPVAAFAVHGRWTGQWSTTRQGRMSVCEVVVD